MVKQWAPLVEARNVWRSAVQNRCRVTPCLRMDRSKYLSELQHKTGRLVQTWFKLRNHSLFKITQSLSLIIVSRFSNSNGSLLHLQMFNLNRRIRIRQSKSFSRIVSKQISSSSRTPRLIVTVWISRLVVSSFQDSLLQIPRYSSNSKPLLTIRCSCHAKYFSNSRNSWVLQPFSRPKLGLHS